MIRVTNVKVEISEIVEEDELSKKKIENRGLDVFQPLFFLSGPAEFSKNFKNF